MSLYSNGSGSQGPSRANSRNGQRPMLDRLPSSMSEINSTSSNTPIATNSVVNKVASASSSLYQNCRTVLARLYRVPGFAQRFLDATDTAPVPTTPDGDSTASTVTTTSSLTPAPFYANTLSPVLGNTADVGGSQPSSGRSTAMGTASIMDNVSDDPVSQSLHTLRLGSSLCFLFNALGLDHQLDVNPAATMSNLKACQRGTAHFVMACKQDLHWADTDLFAIHELYGQDTNGVVKVINTVTKLLDLLEDQGLLLAPTEGAQDTQVVPRPTDDRSMVVREILDSERKYVQDLEVLQDYQRQVQYSDIITPDQVHHLFLNLNTLCDFQRRFLIGVEANASRPSEEQRFGHLFLQMEDHFSVYEPYCANLTAAQDLAIAENASLSKLSHVLDPISELAPLLIKPVQRICKYPLLLQTLVKNTPDSMPHYNELQEGLASIMRVTDRVNETKRKEDNRQAVLDLARRVEDWKGHDINSFGELMLQETFSVIKNDSEREYNIYLFERIILCCREVGPPSGKKSSKSNSIARRPPSRQPARLQLKGRIFVNNVIGATAHHRNGQCLLEVRWRGDVGEEAFTIKCRTDELLKQWQKGITKAVEESPHRRRAHLSASRRSDRGGTSSPLSTFPNTPNVELGPSGSSIFSTVSEATSPYPQGQPSHSNFQPGPNGTQFDDEYDDSTYEATESGRSTPSNMARSRSGGGINTRSLPAEQREAAYQTGSLRRANTEDSNSAVISQWRDQTPGGPPLPRGAFHASNASESQSLRSSASSRQLKGKQSSEWGGGGNSPAMSYGRLPQSYDQQAYPHQSHETRAGLPRHLSHQQVQASDHGAAPPMLRSRSASSPNMYQGPNFSTTQSPQLPDKDWQNYPEASRTNGHVSQGHPYAYGQGNAHDSLASSRGVSYKSNGTNSGGTLASASSISNKKRFSSSSNGTDRSSIASSHSMAHSYTAATSPASTLPPSGSAPSLAHSTSYQSNGFGSRSNSSQMPPLPNGAMPANAASAVRVKVTFGEDTFVVVVLDSISYGELLDKILKKIRLCGRSGIEASHLRLRYQDEDGDRILITSEEDVAMAFEAVRIVGPPGGQQQQTLILFASIDGQR